ncbi:MAG: hypothetical protein FLDDKLPJ_01673 [Phycisphaerae bacterium]|nr:hypothetical protein [Phycisphaerae bacterium]
MPDRTTLAAVLEAVREALADALVANPPTESKPFRRLIPGQTDEATGPRPLLGVALMRTRTPAAVDDDRIVEATLQVIVVADAIAADPHEPLVTLMGRVEDVLDAWRDGGLIEGADGFDRRRWDLSRGRQHAGVRAATAECEVTCVIRVAREENG